MRLPFYLFLAVLLLCPPAYAAKEQGGEGKEEAAVGPQFIAIGPLTVPVVQNGKVQQYVRIAVKLEAKDGADAKQITDRLPVLNDAYLTNLYGAFYAGEGVNGPLLDLDKVRARLAYANSRVLPAGIVQNILIQQASQSRR